jgi:iron complex outermembrane receptor protein
MVRLVKSIVMLVVLVSLGRASPVGAQELAEADASQRPRFLLASDSRLVPLDVDRTPSLARRLGLSLEGVPLKQALQEISNRGALRLAFSDNDIPLGRRVHLQAEAITVAAAFTDVLLGTGLDVVFGRDGGASLVKRSDAAVAQPGRVAGRVTDQQKNVGIAGAEVLLEGTRWRTLTGEDGRYVLGEVPPGSYTITARRIGYGKQSEPVMVADGQEVTADFALQPVAATLGEVVVTAQKREERLINVPQSVSVLPADQLAQTGATQFRDYANTVPGMSFSTSGAGNTQVALRGVTIGYDVGPTVGVYVDEVPYGSSTIFALNAQFALDPALFGLDRIEVLRGPQGTLYGASAMGGLIKYVSKQPDATRFGVDVQAGTAGTRDGGVSANGTLAVNAPIVEQKVGLRASGFYSRDAGYIDNLALGQKDVNHSDIYGGRLDLLATPTDALSIRLDTFLQDISRDGEGTADYTFAGAEPYGSRGQYRLFVEPFDQRFRIVSGTVTYDMHWAALTSISGYQTARTDYLADISAVYVPILNSFGFGPYSAIGFTNQLGTDKFTQEVRLTSRQGSRPFDWVIGGFYTHESSTNNQQFVMRDPAGLPSPDVLYIVSRPSRYKEYAAFGDLTWHLTEKFDVTGGIRYARNNQDFAQTGSGPLGFSLPTNTSSEHVVTYLANARYRFSDQATGYLRYATGYRPGGPNVLTIAGGLPTFEADRLKSYEAGVKAETGDRRFGVDLSGYYIDWSNIQLQVIRSGFGTYVNAPDGATVRGAELALTAHPINPLTVTGTAAYQDAHMSEANADLGAAKGERLPNVPRFTGTLSADYAFLNEGLQPTVGATLGHVGEREVSFDASTAYPQYHLPEHTTVDVRAGVTLGTMRTQLYVHNLFDERGQQSIILPQFGARVAIVQPRTIGVTVTTRF